MKLKPMQRRCAVQLQSDFDAMAGGYQAVLKKDTDAEVLDQENWGEVKAV